MKLLMALLLSLPAALTVSANQDCIHGKQFYQRAAVSTDSERIRWLQKSFSACPTAVAAAELGSELLRAGQPRAAIESLMEARNLSKQAAQQMLIHAELAAAYLSAERVADAVATIDLATAYAVSNDTLLPPRVIAVRRAIDDRVRTAGLDRDQILRVFATKRRALKHKGMYPAPNSVPAQINLYIFFDTDDELPRPDSLPQLRSIADSLSSLPQAIHFRVIGHTDQRGSDDYNLSLSKRRALSIKLMLEIRQATLAGRIASLGRGEREPRYQGNNPDDLARNRRVEVRLIEP